MKIDIRHTAQLANLPLTDKEMKIFEKQLSSVLDYIKKLEEVDTSKVPETNNVTGLRNITKDDTIKPSLTQEEAVSGAKKIHDGLFVVNAILGQ